MLDREHGKDGVGEQHPSQQANTPQQRGQWQIAANQQALAGKDRTGSDEGEKSRCVEMIEQIIAHALGMPVQVHQRQRTDDHEQAPIQPEQTDGKVRQAHQMCCK